MDAKVRRVVEMGGRALAFCRAHLDQSAGYVAALARLEELVARVDLLAGQQLSGIRAVRNATARKRDLRRQIKSAHMEHLSKIARIAARDVPELPPKFNPPGRDESYVAFRTAARTMVAEAMSYGVNIDDNFTIPLSFGAVMWGLLVLFNNPEVERLLSVI